MKTCADHYGARMAEAIKKSLEANGHGGTPLTVCRIKALVEFADGKMGSATTVDAGGKAVELESVGLDKMKRVGMFQDTKLANVETAQWESAEATLRSGAPLGAQDILDSYKAFAKTSMEWLVEDGAAQGAMDYGADDLQSFFGRIASVALSRLAARLGNDAIGRIAAALDTPDGRIPDKHGFPVNIGDHGRLCTPLRPHRSARRSPPCWGSSMATNTTSRTPARKNSSARCTRRKAVRPKPSPTRSASHVENAIHSRPQDFPLLTKYYLNAE